MSQAVRAPCAEGLARATASSPCPEASRSLILASAIAASAMTFIDGSVVTVALPAIRADLGADIAEAQWIINIYVLALAALTLIGGAAADRFGRRRMYVVSVISFAVASLGCAVARTPEALIIARALQGVAGAFLAPAALAVIGASFPPETRTRALGWWASASALATSTGPVLGGVLVEHAHWSWVFLLNLPVAAVALALAWWSLPESRAPGPFGPLDVVGAALAAAGFGCLAYGLVGLGEGRAAATGDGPVVAAFLLGAAGVAAFLAWERRARDPMMPLSLFANPVFSGVTAMTAFMYAGLSAVFFALPFELAEGRGWSATAIGAAFLPFTLAVGVLSRGAGAATDRLGPRRLLVAGALAASLGFVLLASAPRESVTGVLVAMAVVGFGFAMAIAPLTSVALANAPDGRGGAASGVNNAAARAAGLAGAAVSAGLLAAEPGAGYTIAMAAAAVAALMAAALGAATIPRASAMGGA